MIKELAVLAALLFVQSAHADEETTKTIIVEAERISSQEIEASRSAVVIDEAVIRQKNPATVADLLRDVPGLEIIRSGSTGQITSVFIRGALSESTLVLIDGIEANDVTGPTRGFDFAHVPAQSIARIEVYRGPQGVRFGSGALGGVINIITKEGVGDFGVDYLIEGGSYETARLALGANGRAGALSYALGAEVFDSEGFSAANTGSDNSEADASTTGSLSSKLIYSFSPVTKIQTTLRYIKSETELDRGGGPSSDDPNFDAETSRWLFGLSGQTRTLDQQLLSNLGFYYSEGDRSSFNNYDSAAPLDYLKDRYQGQYYKVETNHEYSIDDEQKIRLDVQYREERADIDSYNEDSFGSTYIDVIDQEKQYVFGEGLTYLYESSTIFADFGARSDQPSASDDVISTRASLGTFLGNKYSKIYATYGTGHKTPSLYQLFSQSYGNADLDQEKSRTTEVTVQAGDEKWLAAITAFDNKYRNMIDFSGSKYFNIKKARSQGVELNTSLQLGSLSTKLFAAYLDSEDEKTGLQLLRRPRRTYGLEANYKQASWSTYARYHFRGYRPDSDPVTFGRITTGFYGLVDTGAEYKLSESMSINGRIENLLDKKYEEVAGYGSPERSFYLGLTGRL